MKYIRTKDSIFELVSEEIHTTKVDDELGEYCDFYTVYQPERISLVDKRHTRPIEVARVINSSDNIKDLCDCFAIFNVLTCASYIAYDLSSARINLENSSQKDYCSILGAIFTSKGIIYVAKMNDKGELELL